MTVEDRKGRVEGGVEAKRTNAALADSVEQILAEVSRTLQAVPFLALS